MKTILFIYLFFYYGTLAHAGGWVSGGGELHRDARNPWWLQNTKEVSYCIQIDSASFDLSLNSAKAKVEKAFSYWKKEFKQLNLSTPGMDTPVPATQDFQFQPDCAPEVDLQINFGVLSKRERSFIGKPSEFVALTLRTEYNRESLRGKGFIYISPDKGADRFNTEDYHHPNPWSLRGGVLLELTLLHEIGHLFGIIHSDNFHSRNFMGRDYLEMMVTKDFSQKIADDYQKFGPRMYFDFSKETYTSQACRPLYHLEFFYSVLGINKAEYPCLVIEIKNKVFRVFAGEASLEKRIKRKSLLGEAKLKEIDSSWYETPVFYIPKEQRVFDFNQRLGIPFRPIAIRTESVSYTGIYFSQDAKTAHSLTLSGDESRVHPWRIFGNGPKGQTLIFHGGYRWIDPRLEKKESK